MTSPGTLPFESERLIAALRESSRTFNSRTLDDGIIQEILFQWTEAMESLEEDALAVEAEPGDAEAIAGIKRTLHTLKGDAAIVGLLEISRVIHELESLLERYLQEECCPTDLLLQIRDGVQAFLDDIASRHANNPAEVFAEDAPERGEEADIPVRQPEETKTSGRLSAGKPEDSEFTLQELLTERNRFRESLKAIEGICREMNEPLQLVSGFSELLMMDLGTEATHAETLTTIRTGVDRIEALTRKIMKTARY